MPETTKTPAAETTAETIVAMTPAATSKKAPKQFMLGVSKDDKEEIAAIAARYVGPGVTKEYPMTEKEVVNLLLHVAKNRRFETVYISDPITGEYVYDSMTDDDGEEITFPRTETVDHFEIEKNRVFALRDTAPAKVDNNDPAVLRALMARIQAKLDALGLSLPKTAAIE